MTGVFNSDGDLWIDIEVLHDSSLPGELFGLTAKSEPIPGMVGVYRAVQSFNLTAYIRHLMSEMEAQRSQRPGPYLANADIAIVGNCPNANRMVKETSG